MTDTFDNIVQAIDIAWGPDAELTGPITQRHHPTRYIASNGHGRKAEIVAVGTRWDIERVWNTADAIVVADTTRCRHYDVCDIRDADPHGCAGCYEIWPEPADESALPF